ncbi:MAG: hypothetical protein K8F35_03655, partial [Dokdonella sp.]|uniref:hypothetical protein n=1 Tax=Dokdonella sp. TaxID=2291710 RepID=UPI0025C3C020
MVLDYKGDPKKWLLTAFRKGAGANTTIDTAGVASRDDTASPATRSKADSTTSAKEDAVTADMARKELVWIDMGVDRGERTMVLRFRGMAYGEVSKFEGRNWEFNGERFEGLGEAKAAAVAAGIQRLKRDGYVLTDAKASPAATTGDAAPSKLDDFGERLATKQPPAGTIEGQDALFERLRDGAATLADYKAGWAALQENREAIQGQLGKLTKAQLLEITGPRYRDDQKDRLVSFALLDMETRYAVGRSISYTMGSGSAELSVARLVESATQETIDTYAKDVAN